MKILVVGGTGTIGREVVAALRPAHEVLVAGRTRGELQVDLESVDSIRQLYRSTGKVDAVVSCTGASAFAPFAQLTEEQLLVGIRGKLLTQVHLVRYGLDAVADGGSFTLTGGTLAREPARGAVAPSLVNAALEGFVRAAAIELPRRLRINVVASPWVRETLVELGRDPAAGLPARVVARAYVAAIGGDVTGQSLDARDFA